MDYWIKMIGEIREPCSKEILSEKKKKKEKFTKRKTKYFINNKIINLLNTNTIVYIEYV